MSPDVSLLGRRAFHRRVTNYPMEIKCRSLEGTSLSLSGLTMSISEEGVSCKIQDATIPIGTKSVQLKINVDNKLFSQSGQIVWVAGSRNQCGIKFDKERGMQSEISKFVSNLPIISTSDRRSFDRRTSDVFSGSDKRQQGRRFSDFSQETTSDDEAVQNPKIKNFLRSKSTSYSAETVSERRAWLAQATNTEFNHVAHFSEDLSQFVGKIENPIGVAHTPLGVAGPLRVNGSHARGVFFVPLATTEGALVTSYTLGSHIITRSGGANVALLKDELRVAPMFVFKTLAEAKAFVVWLKRHFDRVKEMAEATSNHLTLNDITHIINGRRVILNFHYTTADAMGMNMACNATEVACRFLTSSVRPEEYWLRSNFNANKKVTGYNFVNGYGKTVTADVIIPRRLINMLNTTPEHMERYFFRTLLADTQAVQIGANGHFANAIAALFIACGQDVASVATSHVGISTCEVTKTGDLYFSVYLSNLLIGTVGGGTHFGTAKECLSMIDCLGAGKSKRFAEIIAATALAGEIGICASIVNGTYVLAHETFGRNKPKE